jgi:hypothetical protein
MNKMIYNASFPDTLCKLIADKYNVSANAIIEIREWANVYFAIIAGIGARFVSKKIVSSVKSEPRDLTGGTEKMRDWAEKIRANTLAKITDVVEHNFCASKIDASWWIAGRSYGNNGQQYNMIFATDIRWMIHAQTYA